MEKTINVRGIQNAETYINRVLAEMKAKNRTLLGVTTRDGESVTFSFENSINDTTKRVIAKQFSKKKYASCDEGMKKFHEFEHKDELVWNHNWRNALEIEQKKYWLVIFVEIK